LYDDHSGTHGNRTHAASQQFDQAAAQIEISYKVGPPATIAKLVRTPTTVVYDMQITIVKGVYKPTNKTFWRPYSSCNEVIKLQKI